MGAKRFPINSRSLVAAILLAIACSLTAPAIGLADHDPANACCPDNDSASQPWPIGLNVTIEQHGNRGATVQGSEYLECPGTQQDIPYGHTVWYRFDVPAKGRVTITTRGISDTRSEVLDTVIAVYQATGQRSWLGCNDDDNPAFPGGSQLPLELQPGAYLVQVGGVDYDTGGPDIGLFSITVNYAEDLDRDDDGAQRDRDCDDDNAGRSPSLPDVTNGIDDNCDNIVDSNRDGDAYHGRGAGPDCDDDNGSVFPGADEVRGNLVDENCDEKLAPFERIKAVARLIGDVGRVFRWKEIVVENVPSGARVSVRCKRRGRSCGSEHKSRRGREGAVKFTRGIVRKLRSRTRLTILVTKDNFIGHYTHYTLRARRSPSDSKVVHCVDEGGTKPPRGKCKDVR